MAYGGFVVVSAVKTSTAGRDTAGRILWWRQRRGAEKFLTRFAQFISKDLYYKLKNSIEAAQRRVLRTICAVFQAGAGRLASCVLLEFVVLSVSI